MTDGPLMRDRARRRRRAIRAWLIWAVIDLTMGLTLGLVTIWLGAGSPISNDPAGWLLVVCCGAVIAGLRIQTARRQFITWSKMRAGEIQVRRPGEKPEQ